MQITKATNTLSTVSRPPVKTAPHNEATDKWAESAPIHTVPQFFRMAVAKNPDGPYLGVNKGGETYDYKSYKEVEREVEQFAGALLEQGLQPGQRVGIFGENKPEWRVADFGIHYAGGIVAPLYNQLSDRNVGYCLRDAEVVTLVVDSKERLDQVLKSELPDLKTIVYTGPAEELQGLTSDKQLVTWNDFLAGGEKALETRKPEMEARINSLNAQELAGMVYTSGSTGDPKGVLLTNGNWMSDVEGVLKVINDNPKETLATARFDDIYPSVLTDGHVMGREAEYAVTAEGGAIAYPEGLMGFKKDLKKIKPTLLAVTPLFFQKIYEEAEKKAHKSTDPAINPKLAGLGAGAAAGALGAVAGGLAGAGLGGGALTWGLSIAGGVLAGAAADHYATGLAKEWTSDKLWDASVKNAKAHFEGNGEGSAVGQFLAEKFVFSKFKEQVNANTGGNIRLMMSGGAALSGEVEATFRSAGFNISQGYGLSETAGASIMNNPFKSVIGTVGEPLPGVEVRLGDGNELQLKGPNIMAGYLKKPEKTAETFTPDGWHRTGDVGKKSTVKTGNPLKTGLLAGAAGAVGGALIGSLAGVAPWLGAVGGAWLAGGIGAFVADTQEKEVYTVVGRIKSQFKLPGGEYVTPEPIEDSLKASPFIGEAVVVGATERDLVGALIVPKFDNLKKWCKDNNLPTEPEAMCAHPDVIKMVAKDALERSSVHAPHEKVRAVALLPKEFTLENDEMTPSMKIKRPVILEHYKEQIKGMF